jgi:CheY-like chemotaxis protein
MLRRVIPANIELAFSPGKDVGSVHGDPGQLEQVLLNLCVNARDALPDGGRIAITTRTVELDEVFCAAHPGARPGRYLLLTVSDTGVGMDEDTLARVFDPFFTTKEGGEGTGLGRATVHGGVEQHGGLVSIESSPGEGTMVSVCLPTAAREGGTARGGPDVEAAPTGSETILVAEDDAQVRTLAERVLTRAGYRVLSAADGREAVELFLRHADGIDLALIDVVMPGLGGREVRDRVVEHRPDVRVLFSSGYSGDQLGTRLDLEDEARILAKPYNAATLLRRIREVLDG